MRSAFSRFGLSILLALAAACSGGGGGGGGTTSPVPPSVTAHPQSVTVNQGQNATFSVSASGTTPLNYQWRKGGASLAGSTGASLTIVSAQPGDVGSYDVVVSNSAGSVTSAAATLTVNVPPSITSQPQSQSVLAPAQATFEVTAAGTFPLTYQWKRNGTDIPGATSPSYKTPATASVDDGAVFSVTVANVVGNLSSANATLTVHVAAAITVQPQAQSVVAPASATFSVGAVGTPPLTYQWKKNGSVVGGSTSSYTTPATTSTDNGAIFSVTVSNAYGTETSGNAALTVNLPPSITVQPANRTVTEPATATFSVTATGAAPLSYQWRKNGLDIGSANSSTYTTPPTTIGDNGALFSVKVSNPFGDAFSDNATLTVNGAPALDLSIASLYITQGTQNQAFNVPLVQDRSGFLRVFVVANQANTATPQVRVRIYNAANTLIQTYPLISDPKSSVPTSVDESSLSNSWNVAISSTYLQPGNKLLVDVDPSNAIVESNEGNNTWPASGSAQALDVRTLPPFRVTFWSVQTGDSRVGNVSSGSASSYTSLLEKIWPINNATDRAYGGVFTVSDTLGGSATWNSVLGKLDAKRTADGVTNRYYYGVVNPSYSGGIAGLGYVGWPVAIGWDKSTGYSDSGQYPGVYAHETGHNLGLEHAPCGGPASPDPAFPYPGGGIGVWGTDVSTLSLKDPAHWTDIMGYCSSVWVSDYNYKITLANRQGATVPIILPAPTPGATATRSILLWGGLENGIPVLEPTFHLGGNAQPPQPGDQLLEGLDAEGRILFSVSFSLVEVGCLSPGTARHFCFSIPVATADADRLTGLRWTRGGEVLALRGGVGFGGMQALGSVQEPIVQALPDGRTRLLWDAAAHPMVMVQDKATGLVLGLGEGGDFRFHAEAEKLELHFSDGVRSHSRVVRRPRLDDGDVSVQD